MLFSRNFGSLVLFAMFKQDAPVHRLAAHSTGLKGAGLARDRLGQLWVWHGWQRFAVAPKDVTLQPNRLDSCGTMGAHHRPGPEVLVGVAIRDHIFSFQMGSPALAISSAKVILNRVTPKSSSRQ